jgi:hypothetical protein
MWRSSRQHFSVPFYWVSYAMVHYRPMILQERTDDFVSFESFRYPENPSKWKIMETFGTYFNWPKIFMRYGNSRFLPLSRSIPLTALNNGMHSLSILLIHLILCLVHNSQVRRRMTLQALYQVKHENAQRSPPDNFLVSGSAVNG